MTAQHNYSRYGQTDGYEQADAFNPLTLLFYVIQYRWLLALLVATGVVAGVVVTMMQTPKYQATAQLEVLVPSAKVFQDIEVMSEVSDLRSFLTAREKLNSRALAQRVVFELGLTEKADFLFPTPDFSLPTSSTGHSASKMRQISTNTARSNAKDSHQPGD